MGQRNTPESFWAQVEKTDGCWNWKLSVNRDGYGSVKYHSKTERSHDLAYRLAVGPVPPGHELHHTCDNRRCCNPAHLHPIPHAEHLSLHRALRIANPATHCRHGHLWSEANSWFNAQGYRLCRECWKTYGKTQRQKKKKSNLG